ncbi:MAG: sulfurtransferase [Myxococcales bacterium 68-20]|nr:sulfurtransferase [Myxococcales bacterium]OJY25016.1 MAG: sulfurtransferase [Myxococcales bacterium 68-20]
MSELPLVVDGSWLQERLGDPRLRIVDATVHLKLPAGDGYYTLAPGRESYEREHIPGAVFADLLGELADPAAPHPMTVPSSARFAERIGALGVGDDSLVVVYDQLDVARGPEYYQFWAPRLWWHLRLEGFSNVAVLDGGLGRWKREGRPTTSESASYPAAKFTPRRRQELLALADDVQHAITDARKVLVNVLDPDTFSGKKQTYARRGRIPNSAHVFFGLLIDPETGGLRSPEQVKEHFERVGALDPAKRSITYCGGGIAATVAALQLARLGRDDVAVYDGSLTEWASDLKRPLEVSP